MRHAGTEQDAAAETKPPARQIEGGGESTGLGVEGTATTPEDKGQLVEVRFRAPRQGKYDLTLFCLSGDAHILQGM